MIFPVCLVCLLLLPVENTSINTLKIYEHARPAIVRITAADPAGHLRVGSGVIVRADGVIVTDYRLVDGVKSVRVQLATGAAFDKVSALGADKQHDVVFLKIDASNLPALDFKYPDKGRLQHLVFVIGPPMDLGIPITSGTIVSAPSSQQVAANSHHIPLITFSSVLTQLNTGGPLLDEDGKVIGMISWAWSVRRTEAKPAPGSDLQILTAGQNGAIPADYIKKLQEAVLGSPGTEPNTVWDVPGPLDAVRHPADILAASKSIFVFVERGNINMQQEIEKRITDSGGLSIAPNMRSADLVLLIVHTGLVKQTFVTNRYMGGRNLESSEAIEALASLRDAHSGLELWYTTQRHGTHGKDDFSEGLSKKFIRFLKSEAREKK